MGLTKGIASPLWLFMSSCKKCTQCQVHALLYYTGRWLEATPDCTQPTSSSHDKKSRAWNCKTHLHKDNMTSHGAPYIKNTKGQGAHIDITRTLSEFFDNIQAKLGPFTTLRYTQGQLLHREYDEHGTPHFIHVHTVEAGDADFKRVKEQVSDNIDRDLVRDFQNSGSIFAYTAAPSLGGRRKTRSVRRSRTRSRSRSAARTRRAQPSRRSRSRGRSRSRSRSRGRGRGRR